MREPEDLDEDLDILGHQLLVRLYTQICFCFPVADVSSHPAIIGTLIKGLERLTLSFPWLAGQVVREFSVDGRPGVFRIKPLDEVPYVAVKELGDDPSIPTMDDLRRASFPFSMLDEGIIAPYLTLPASVGDDSCPAPVLALQANFVKGGLLLTIVVEHSTMDMPGQAQIMKLLSKACHNEPFTDEELSTGNLPRRNIIPLLDASYKPGPELAHQLARPPPNPPAQSYPSPACSWAYFSFSAASLAALKSLTLQTLEPGGPQYISTDDALTALIWQCTTRVRLPRLEAAGAAETTLARAVDVRRYVGISATYPGNIQNMTYTSLAMRDLVREPLGRIAARLRAALDPTTSGLGHRTRALATWLARAPDRSVVGVTAGLDPATDPMVSSWAAVPCYELDFNLGLGKPEAVRRPRFVPVEGLIYFMPKTPDGEIAVGVCLRDEEMDRLKKDEEFGRYGRYVG